MMLSIIFYGLGAIGCIVYGLFTLRRERKIKKSCRELVMYVGKKQNELDDWYRDTQRLLDK